MGPSHGQSPRLLVGQELRYCPLIGQYSPALLLYVWIRTLKTWIELLNTTLVAFVSSENVVLAGPGLFYFYDPIF